MEKSINNFFKNQICTQRSLFQITGNTGETKVPDFKLSPYKIESCYCLLTLEEESYVYVSFSLSNTIHIFIYGSTYIIYLYIYVPVLDKNMYLLPQLMA